MQCRRIIATKPSARYTKETGGLALLPKLKPEELESRRREIIDAARVCFLRHGFHQTTTDQICREASITPGGLYHYFGSKEEIIEAVIEQNARDVVGRLMQLADRSTHAASAFRDVAQFLSASLADPETHNATRLDLEIWAEAVKNDRLAEMSGRGWETRRRWVETLIKRGIADGVYDGEVVDPRGMASLLITLFIGLRIGRALWPGVFDIEGALRALYLMQTGQMVAEIPPPPIITRQSRAATG